eukprot:scaffold10670_cov142-Isochrysis_galbana.AAC.8
MLPTLGSLTPPLLTTTTTTPILCQPSRQPFTPVAISVAAYFPSVSTEFPEGEVSSKAHLISSRKYWRTVGTGAARQRRGRASHHAITLTPGAPRQPMGHGRP